MDNVINWINNEIMRNQIYHDHKESMIWASFSLYLSGAVALILWLNNTNANLNKCGLITGIIIATATAVIYIFWQWFNRELAGGKVEGLTHTITVLHQSQSMLGNLDWTFDEDSKLPRFVLYYTKIKRKRDIPCQRILCNFVLLILPMAFAFVTMILMVCRI